MKPIVTEVLNIAGRQVGVRETGENRGPKVNEYLRSVGLPQGNPWCMAFVFWVLEEATRMMHQRNPFLRSGYCPYVDSWAEGQGILRETPEPGDVFLRYGNVGKVFRAHHTGFVTEVDGAGFGTIEGNTNLGGSPEGVGVFRRERKIGKDYRFVRWAELLEPEPEKTWDLELNGVKIANCPTIGGRALCPVRVLGAALGKAVTWDAEKQVVLYDDEEVPVDVILIGQKAYAPIRDLTAATGTLLGVDEQKKLLRVTQLEV